MNKQSLHVFAQYKAFELLEPAKKDETIEAYAKRAFPNFQDKLSKESNPITVEACKDMQDSLLSGVANNAIRLQLVANWAKVNNPFEHETPKDATDDEILQMNGIKKSAKDTIAFLGEEGFRAYMNTLKAPKKTSLGVREIEELKTAHFVSVGGDVYPSKKSVSVGKDTHSFHWEGKIQHLYIADNKAFLTALELNDLFLVEALAEAEAEAEAKAEASK